jgi:hypothetical protein
MKLINYSTFQYKKSIGAQIYQWFVAETTRKSSWCLHGALSSLKKRLRFLPMWVVITIEFINALAVAHVSYHWFIVCKNLHRVIFFGKTRRFTN